MVVDSSGWVLQGCAHPRRQTTSMSFERCGRVPPVRRPARRPRVGRMTRSVGRSRGRRRTGEMTADVVIVANRLPVDRVVDADGTTTWRRSPGGLVSALAPVMTAQDGAWIGWPGDVSAADEELAPFEHEGMTLVPVPISATEYEEYYEGFSNATLWPLYHDLVAKPEFHREWWDSYIDVNQRFAGAAAE